MQPNPPNILKQSPKRDCPNYRAFALRPAFLSTLFLFVCGLTIALECLLRVLPNEHNRNKIPQDSPFIVARRGAAVDSYPRSSTLLPTPFSRTENGRTIIDSTRTRIRRHVDTPQPQITTPPSLPRSDFNIKIPDPSMYANTNPIEGFVTWADRWYGDPGDPFARTPVWPGQEVADKCIYSYQGIVLTANTSGCRAIWDPTGKMAVSPGWKPAMWVTEMLLVESEGKCAENYDDWYAKYPSNPYDDDSRPSNDNNNKEVNPGRRPDLFADFNENLFSCTWANGSNLNDTYKNTGNALTQVLFVYQGNFTRHENGSIQWMTTSVRDVYHVYPRTLAPRNHGADGHVGHEVFSPGPGENGRWLYLEDRPVIIYDAPTWKVTSPTSPSATSLMPSTTVETAISKGDTQTTGVTDQAEITQTSFMSTSTTATQIPLQSFSPSLYETPVTLKYVTTTQLTVDGKLITDITTIKATSKVLFQLPPAMAPATPVTTQTDSDGNPTRTVTDFGGQLILTTKLTTITNEQGEPVATFLTTAPATSRVKTITDNDGNSIAIVTTFPVYPNVPGAKPANLVLAKQFSYFFVYFFPILLSILVLVPIHIIDAEVKLLIPFRVLADPTSKTKSTTSRRRLSPLHVRTDGFAGRIAGWRLLIHHGDPLSVISDLIVLSAALLVALSGETIGLKLRGTCIKQNMHACLVTVAAFPTPARAAEGLLGLLMVLIVALGFCLSRKRTGIATHPGTIAAVCTLLQIPETRRVISQAAGVNGPEIDEGKNLRKMLERELKGAGTEFALSWVEDGARANDYGLIVQTQQQQQTVEKLTTRNGTKRLNYWKGKRKMTFRISAAERCFQVFLLLFLVSILTVLLYYENTRYTDITESAFEYFMDSQEFGVILLFTVVGEAVYLLWDQLFCSEFSFPFIFNFYFSAALHES